MALEVEGDRESPAVAAGSVLAATGGFVALVIVIVAGLGFVLRAKLPAHAVDRTIRTFPIPEIQPNPTRDYLSFRERQDGTLAGYAWVDRDKGLIRVPIARAMAIVAAKGAAAYDPPDPAPPEPVSVGRPPDGAPRVRATLPAQPYGAAP